MAIRKTTVTEEIEAQPSADQLRQEEIARQDAAVMVGGPGSDSPEPTTEKPAAAPELVELRINGRSFKVDPEFAQAYDQRNRDFDRKLNEKQQEAENLRKQFQPPPVEQPKGYDTLLFENPNEAITRLKKEIREEVTQEYVADQSQQRFWNGFYSTHKDLNREDDDFLVRGVLQQNWQRLSPLALEEASKELADLTRRQILRYSQKGKLEDEGQPITAARTQVEPASRPTPRAVKPRDDEGPATLTDVINQRRAAKRRGRAA